jgi:UDP:flavonoid glycosyltransferase YjiC (YdhE family)
MGLGPGAIPRSRLSAPRLAGALRTCLADADLRARTRAFAAQMTLDGLDRAIATIEALANRQPPERPTDRPERRPSSPTIAPTLEPRA